MGKIWTRPSVMTRVYLILQNGQVYLEEIDLCHSRRIRAESFSLKYNPTTFEYKIHLVEVDIYYLKYL